MDQTMKELLARVERIEAIEEIKALKARYLNACDKQEPEAVRECFVAQGAIVDMDYFGYCDNRDAFVDDVFVPRGCHDYVLDMHHGANPEIEILDEKTAQGVWSLNYRNINTQDHTLTMLSALYHDDYVKTDAGWRIAKSRTEYRTVMVCNYEPGSLRVDAAARTLADVM